MSLSRASGPLNKAYAVSFPPNPLRRHTRGKRGRHVSQLDDSNWALKRRSVVQEREKRERAMNKRFKQRGARGADFKKLRGAERTAAIEKLAHHRRVTTTTVGGDVPVAQMSRRTRKTLEGFGMLPTFHRPTIPWNRHKNGKHKTGSIGKPAFNLLAAMARFRRDGTLPPVSVEEFKAAATTGVNQKQYKKMLSALLMIGGVESNPGPKQCPNVGLEQLLGRHRRIKGKRVLVCRLCGMRLLRGDNEPGYGDHPGTLHSLPGKKTVEEVLKEPPPLTHKEGKQIVSEEDSDSSSESEVESVLDPVVGGLDLPSEPCSSSSVGSSCCDEPLVTGAQKFVAEPSTSSSDALSCYGEPLAVVANMFASPIDLKGDHSFEKGLRKRHRGSVKTHSEREKSRDRRAALAAEKVPKDVKQFEREFDAASDKGKKAAKKKGGAEKPKEEEKKEEVVHCLEGHPISPEDMAIVSGNLVSMPGWTCRVDGHRPVARHPLHSVDPRTWFCWDVNVHSTEVTQVYGGERRVATDRNVLEIKSSMKVVELDVSTREPRYGRSWIWYTFAAWLLYTVIAIAIAPLSVWVMAPVPLVVPSCVLVVALRPGRRVRKYLTYAPHLLSCVLKEYDRHTSKLTVRQSLRSKILRMSSLPIIDKQSAQIIAGTEEIVAHLVASDNYFWARALTMQQP